MDICAKFERSAVSAFKTRLAYHYGRHVVSCRDDKKHSNDHQQNEGYCQEHVHHHFPRKRFLVQLLPVTNVQTHLQQITVNARAGLRQILLINHLTQRASDCSLLTRRQ